MPNRLPDSLPRPSMAALLAAVALPSAAAWESTAWQRELLASVAQSSAARSADASAELLARLGEPTLRAELLSCSPESANWTAAELLQRLRAEVSVTEVVSGFSSRAWQGQMSLDEATSGTPFFENNWQMGVRHKFNFSGAFGWFDIQDDVESKLYGFKPFARHGQPQTMEEASERTPYFLLNLNRVDAGSTLYGDASVVLSPALVNNVSIIASADTGGWTALCNSTQKRPEWLPKNYKPNCKSAPNRQALGTLQHTDHLFLMNSDYWNVSLSRSICRMLAPWGQVPVAGRDLIHYFEVMPAANLTYPSAIKFVIGSFPSLFGAAEGDRLRRWCLQNKWALVWSLGLNLGNFSANFWTAGNMTDHFASNWRVVDPEVAAQVGANVTASADAERRFELLWARANLTRRIAEVENRSVSNGTWSIMWSEFEAALSKNYRIEPLRAGACGDVGGCIGTAVPSGDCVCYGAQRGDLLVV